ncbi:MAG: hypothetical protein RI947_392 [Candidatus Parcubacteria bacterium]|jgi:16S rRNA (cytosine1407-C5)-methyltransferase
MNDLNISEDFLSRAQKILSLHDQQQVAEKFSYNRPVSLRVNTIKSTMSEIQTMLRREQITAEPVPWWNDALIVHGSSARTLTELPEYEKGYFYIQNLSSMIPPLVLDPQKNERILDLTSAPGSKTTQIAALMENTGEIVANDISRTRLYKLQANLDRYGITNTHVKSYPAEVAWKHYIEYFDRTLLDAPCSMEGTFNVHDASTYANWSLKQIKRLAQQQKWMLRSAVSATKPGGIIVYSTCTLAPEENEEAIEWIMTKEKGNLEILSVDLPSLPFSSGITEWKHKKLGEDLKHTLRITPSATMEGFFVAKMRKLRSNVRQTPS